MSNIEAFLWLFFAGFVLWISHKVATLEEKVAKLEEIRIRFDLAAGRMEQSVEKFQEARDHLNAMVKKVEDFIKCP